MISGITPSRRYASAQKCHCAFVIVCGRKSPRQSRRPGADRLDGSKRQMPCRRSGWGQRCLSRSPMRSHLWVGLLQLSGARTNLIFFRTPEEKNSLVGADIRCSFPVTVNVPVKRKELHAFARRHLYFGVDDSPFHQVVKAQYRFAARVFDSIACQGVMHRKCAPMFNEVAHAAPRIRSPVNWQPVLRPPCAQSSMVPRRIEPHAYVIGFGEPEYCSHVAGA